MIENELRVETRDQMLQNAKTESIQLHQLEIKCSLLIFSVIKLKQGFL